MFVSVASSGQRYVECSVWRSIACAWLAFGAITFGSLISSLPAQTDASNSTGAFTGGFAGGLGDGLGGNAAAGGAAMADFDTLMNLIQQTIDPDSWLANGGTSTILPYPAGVYVDPKGHLKRIRASEQLRGDLIDRTSSRLKHPWREESNLRTVSLKELDRALQINLRSGVSPTAELTKLAGLTKVTYVKLDLDNEDILISGPAGQSVHGFELQDLAVVASLIRHDTTPMGCSIEPSNEGLLAAQAMLQKQGTTERLARNPRMVVEQMQEKIGAHNVRVFGMPAATGTAVALLDADEHMKKVGFGTVQTPQRINSYFDYLDKQDKIPSQSLIRWWFAYSDSPIKVSMSGDMFQLPEDCVRVLSEQQWVSQQGRAPTGANDSAADSFAVGMSEHLHELRGSHASYARLHAVFELSLALQLMVEKTGQPSLDAWLPTLCALGKSVGMGNPEPKTVEGLTTWHKLKNGTIVAVVSGGVKIDTLELADSQKWSRSRFLASSVVPTQPEQMSAAHGRWWWDAE